MKISNGKKFSITICVLFLTFVFGYLSFIPVHKIMLLKKANILVEVQDAKAKYHFDFKKPKNWVSLKQISQKALEAIIISEDWAFYQHNGYDVNQIYKAVEDHIKKGKNLRGASTITQQVAKNLFLSNEKTFTRKFQEVLIAIHLEKILSKKRILEIYVNIIEFGDQIYGIELASKFYFKKNASKLSPKEGAFLAMVLPNPKKYAQSFRQKRLTEYAKQTIEDILNKLVFTKNITPIEKAEELSSAFHWEEYSEHNYYYDYEI